MSWSVAASRSASSGVHAAGVGAGGDRVDLVGGDAERSPRGARAAPTRTASRVRHATRRMISSRWRWLERRVAAAARGCRRGTGPRARGGASAWSSTFGTGIASGPVGEEALPRRSAKRRAAARRARRRPTARGAAERAEARRRRSQVPAAVDADQLTGDVARVVGAQERARGRDVVGRPGPARPGCGPRRRRCSGGHRAPRRGAPSACR